MALLYAASENIPVARIHPMVLMTASTGDQIHKRWIAIDENGDLDRFTEEPTQFQDCWDTENAAVPDDVLLKVLNWKDLKFEIGS